MKTIKYIKSLMILSFIFMASISFAQSRTADQGRGKHEMPPIPGKQQIKEMVNDLAKELTLTEIQERTIQNLYIEHFEEVKTKTSGKKRPQREEMEALKSAFEESIKAVLTGEEQLNGYKSFLKKMEKSKPRR